MYFLADVSNSTLAKEVARITAIIEKETKSVVIGDQRLGKSPSRPGYNTYSNLRFGYQIDYPEDFVSKAPRRDESNSNLPLRDKTKKCYLLLLTKEHFSYSRLGIIEGPH